MIYVSPVPLIDPYEQGNFFHTENSRWKERLEIASPLKQQKHFIIDS